MIAIPSPFFCSPRFPTGSILATPDAIAALQKSGESLVPFLARHVQGDWGEMCDDDRKLNDEALDDGSRIMSAYSTAKGTKFWIITEAADENGHRVCTTALLPENY